MDTNWSNAALVAYSLLPKIADSLDSALKTRVNSCYQSRHLKMGLSNEQLIGEIIEITEQKRRIVNLAYIVNSTLERMKPCDRQIIEERIFKKKTFQNISAELDIALRTAFRRMDVAEKRFADILASRGYTEAWFEKEYGADKYISSVKQRLDKEKYLIAKNY